MRFTVRSLLQSRFVLLLLLAASVVWVLRLHRAPTSAAPEQHPGLPSGFGEVSSYLFESGGESLLVSRRGSEFWLTRPLRDRADLFFLLEVRRQAEELKAGRVLPDSQGAAYGLDPPRWRLTLVNAQGASWTLAVGDSTPVGSQLYAQAGGKGNRILLMDQFIARKYFRPSLNSLRDRVCAPLRDGPVDSIAVMTPVGRLAAARQGEERWRCRTPDGLMLDAIKINPVIQTLRNPAISDYPPRETPLASVGLAPPRALWILYQGSRAESVRIGNPTADQLSVHVIPSRRTAIALIPSEDFRSLVDGWPALADLHLLSTPAESLTAVEFLDVPRAGSYRLQGGRWVRFPSGHAVSRRRDLERDLHNIVLLQWKRYPRAERTPDPRRAGLRLRLASAAAAETLWLCEPTDSTSLARSTLRRRWGEVDPWMYKAWRYHEEHPE